MKTKEYYEREMKKIDDLREKLGESITMKQSRELASKRKKLYIAFWMWKDRNKIVK